MCDHDYRLDRRQVLSLLAWAGTAFAAGCANSPASPSSSSSNASTTVGSTNATCAVTPSETIGPYPSLVDLVRSDVRETRPGTKLTLNVQVVNTASGCAPVPGAFVEIWQCDAAGNYSAYGNQVGQTWLRGFQQTDANGQVTFTTIYPGWYQGRATHIHAEVTINGVSRRVTQMAFPESVNNTVHTSGVYASRGTNPTTNLADGIFADSLAAELVTPVGDPTNGYTATFQISL